MTIVEENIEKLLTRMRDTDDYIIRVENRYYWANDTKVGVLMETASADEIFIILTMVNSGDTRIVNEFKHNML